MGLNEPFRAEVHSGKQRKALSERLLLKVKRIIRNQIWKVKNNTEKDITFEHLSARSTREIFIGYWEYQGNSNMNSHKVATTALCTDYTLHQCVILSSFLSSLYTFVRHKKIRKLNVNTPIILHPEWKAKGKNWNRAVKLNEICFKRTRKACHSVPYTSFLLTANVSRFYSIVNCERNCKNTQAKEWEMLN